MTGIKIIATGAQAPKKIVSNDDLAKIVETSDEWISQRTGMSLRHYVSEGENHTWLAEMAEKFGWENLVNKKSTTWRGLDSEIKDNLNKELALEVLQANPTLIKRPIVLNGNIALIGFNQESYQQAFKK